MGVKPIKYGSHRVKNDNYREYYYFFGEYFYPESFI